MKVKELIELLEDYDGDSEVRLMTQENWPFENAIAGTAERTDFEELEEDEDGNEIPNTDGCASDVFIVEGKQICYGDKGAWDAARR